MKQLLIIAIFIAICTTTFSQERDTIDLEQVYNLARSQYPISKKQVLIEKSRDYTISNISKGGLPQFSVNGQASYQSDVTGIPVKLPNAEIPSLSKDQYKVYAEISQEIYDGGNKKLLKEQARVSAEVEQQALEVELYQLKTRLNELYFGILYLQPQLRQSELMRSDIQLGLNKIRAAISNGTALKSNSDILEADLLKTKQRIVELQAAAKSYRKMLGLFINRQVNENTVLIKPPVVATSYVISRPELELFEKEKKSVDIQSVMVNTKTIPRLNLFLQGGYGRPGLNMLKNNFETYYIGGVRLNWSLSGLYTSKKEKARLDIKSQVLDLQKETFLFNTQQTIQKQDAEIEKLKYLISSDSTIVELRDRIKKTALAQLEYGVINSSDYLREVNAADQARQTQLLHEIQLLRSMYDLKITTGN